MLFRATPLAYGSSQANGRIRAAAVSHSRSHSHTGSKPCLQPTPQLTAKPDPSLTEQGQGSTPHRPQSGLEPAEPQWELPKQFLKSPLPQLKVLQNYVNIIAKNGILWLSKKREMQNSIYNPFCQQKVVEGSMHLVNSKYSGERTQMKDKKALRFAVKLLLHKQRSKRIKRLQK